MSPLKPVVPPIIWERTGKWGKSEFWGLGVLHPKSWNYSWKSAYNAKIPPVHCHEFTGKTARKFMGKDVFVRCCSWQLPKLFFFSTLCYFDVNWVIMHKGVKLLDCIAGLNFMPKITPEMQLGIVYDPDQNVYTNFKDMSQNHVC